MLKYLELINWQLVGAISLVAFGGLLAVSLFFVLLENVLGQATRVVDRGKDAASVIGKIFRRSGVGENSADGVPAPEQVFFQALNSALATDSIRGLSDVEDLFLGTPRLRVRADRLRESLADSLRRYLVLFHTDPSSKDSVGQDAPKKIGQVSAFVAACQEGAPYDGLPAKERTIISDMLTFLKAGDSSAALRKLPELASAIEARESIFARIERVNRYSMPIALASALSAVIGLVSVLVQMAIP